MAQEKFTQAQTAVDNALLDLETAKRAQGLLINTLEEKQQYGMLAQELARFEERIHYNQTQLVLLKKTFDKKRAVAEIKRKLLLEKAKDHKVLDTLKIRQNRSWKSYLEKKEAAMLDEIAILHHDRKIS